MLPPSVLFIEVVFERYDFGQHKPAAGIFFIVTHAHKLERLAVFTLRKIGFSLASELFQAVLIQSFGIILIGVFLVV